MVRQSEVRHGLQGNQEANSAAAHRVNVTAAGSDSQNYPQKTGARAALASTGPQTLNRELLPFTVIRNLYYDSSSDEETAPSPLGTATAPTDVWVQDELSSRTPPEDQLDSGKGPGAMESVDRRSVNPSQAVLRIHESGQTADPHPHQQYAEAYWRLGEPRNPASLAFIDVNTGHALLVSLCIQSHPIHLTSPAALQGRERGISINCYPFLASQPCQIAYFQWNRLLHK